MKDKIIKRLEQMAEVADEQRAKLIEDMIKRIEVLPEPTASRLVCVEPFLIGGVVTRKVWRCANCKGQVGERDHYCRECGRRLSDE